MTWRSQPKPHPLPDWFSETAQREARKAEGPDELFGAAYSEGARDERKRMAVKRQPQRHATTAHGLQHRQFKNVMAGVRKGKGRKVIWGKRSL